MNAMIHSQEQTTFLSLAMSVMKSSPQGRGDSHLGRWNVNQP